MSPQVRAKWPVSLLEEGFVPFSKKLLRALVPVLGESTEPLQDLAAILVVIDYIRPAIQRPPSPEYLAFNAGLDRDVLMGALNRLAARGLVEYGIDDHGRLELDLEGFYAAVDDATSEELSRAAG
jgi:hypothetical protein